jgi:hypothetical protein
MKVLASLQSLSQYPVPDNAVERICIVRGLDINEDVTLTITTSQAFELASADVYMYILASPSLKEQEVSITVQDRKYLKQLAENIYTKYDDELYLKYDHGFIGDDWNG